MRITTITMLILICTAQVFAQNGVISEIAGTVELKHAGEAGFVPARAGDSVAQNTVVSTGIKGFALIAVGSTVITVRPITRLTFAEITASAGSERLGVNLQAGRVRVDVNPPAGTRADFTVQSPSATASVRGTSFEFDTQSITVLEGTVSFLGSGGAAVLAGAGSSSEIANGRAADPMDIFLAELKLPPPAGSDSGFVHSGGAGQAKGEFDSDMGEFGLDFELK